jgi:hypothetical protein
MKRLKVILPVLLLLFIGFLLISSFSRSDPNAPRYVPVKTQPSGPFGSVHYDWGGATPFVGGKVWIFTILSRTNGHEFLFDLEKRKVLGELFNGGAVFANQDQTKLLCGGRASMDTSIKGSLSALLSKLSHGKLHFHTNRIDTYWILDLRNNSARRLGGLSQWPGTGSNWRPSPGFRFGYNVPNNGEEGSSFFLYDLDLETFQKIQFAGNLRGWWDDRRVLIKKPTGDLVLYDVLAQTTSTLFDLETISRRLRELGIPDDPATLTTYSIWNGTNYEFNLVAKQGWNWYSNGSFMVKIDRSSPALSLFRPNFKFGWQGTFNATETQYVYDGEPGASGKGGNGGVFLLDLLSSNTTTLIPPDNKGQYAIPRFYGNTVLYFRNRELWSVKADGSGNRRLFPPPDK